MSQEKNCTNCTGTGKQIFHGSFQSVLDNCNFCKGTGLRSEQLNWFMLYNNPNQHELKSGAAIDVDEADE